MKTLAIILALLGLVALCSCNQNDEEPFEPESISLDEKSSALVKAGNEFSLELFQNIYSEEKEYDNIMVSPLSVSLALAMTYNGANGETQTAMEKTLKVYGLTPDDINQSYKSLVEALQSLDPKVLLEIANAIYYRQDFAVEQNFISTNQNYYNAEVEALDFSSSEAVKTINNWVANKTHDKIKEIIQDIKPSHVMFLLNAIYFKGIWQTEFDEKNTSDLQFNLENGSTVSVPSMQKEDTVSYFANDLFSAIKLPYGAGNYNMFLFLPNQDKTVKNICEELNEDNWDDWTNNFGQAIEASILIPRLKYEYEIKLNDVLSTMGMGIAFGGGADFTGINSAGGLYIDYVKHKTFIEVNEEGTEAAAVTIVAIDKLSAGPTPMVFHANRPFFYAITEKDTGAILFMGTVKNPESEGK